MIKIFAKKGTDEKVAIECLPRYNAVVIGKLNERFGGEWIAVETIDTFECIKFNDGDIYKGFDNRAGRYSKAIGKLL